MVEEIQEESPLGYKLVRVSAPMDPRNMASLDADTHQTMFDAIVGIMHSNKRISGKQGDCAKEQYEQFFAENSGCKQEWISWFQHESNMSWKLPRFLFVE